MTKNKTPQGENALLSKVKKLIGVEPGTRLQPMIAYNSAIFFSGGGPYVLGCYLLPFQTKVEGLTTEQYGTVALFSCICDAITDPLMGIITDRTRHKDGRHRPYLKYGVIPAMIAFFLMWNSFGISSSCQGGNTRPVMLYYIFAYMLYKTVSTMIMVPHTAMLPGIAPGYNQRTQFNAVRTVMDAVASYSSFFVAATVLGGISGVFVTPSFGPEHRSRFTLMAAILCLWTSLPLIFTYKGTKEESSLEQVNEKLDLREFFGQYIKVAKNRVFRQYFLFGFIMLFGSAFVSQSFYYFLETVLHQESNYSMLTMAQAVGEILGFLPAYFLSIKKNKQLPAKVFMPVAVSALGLAWLTRNSGTAIFIFIVEFMYGLGLSGMASVQNNIFPDVTDVDEMITGERREGVISTFSTFIRKFVNGFAAFGIGKLLGWFGYNTQLAAAQQSSRAVFGVTICFTLIPMVFMFLSFLSIMNYKLTREKLSFIREKIKEKKEKGYIEITESEKKDLEKISGQKFENMWIGQ
ncbi:MAG: MFS transporter [Clostridia bacterium]|nr:MFS transporter [Clostridia bacterium]